LDTGSLGSGFPHPAAINRLAEGVAKLKDRLNGSTASDNNSNSNSKKHRKNKPNKRKYGDGTTGNGGNSSSSNNNIMDIIRMASKDNIHSSNISSNTTTRANDKLAKEWRAASQELAAFERYVRNLSLA